MGFKNTPSSSGNKRRYHSAVMADMNMLPMIDVMLVLLILFMVAAPLLNHAVNIKLPTASNAPMPADTQPIAIAIEANGQISVNQNKYTLETLPPALSTLVAQTASPSMRPVQIYADKVVPYGTVAQVMSALGTAGLTQLRFATVP
jgi:biopolymer transport protein ExbD